MARHYYLTRSGKLRRKDNTLSFIPSEEEIIPSEEIVEASSNESIGAIPDIEMGDLDLEADPLTDDETVPEEIPTITLDEENDAPVRVAERRVIPIEDVDALWVFRELDLNSRALNFLSQKKVPAHFFNYYGFYSGSFYPREFLQAGYLTVRQVRQYARRQLTWFRADPRVQWLPADPDMIVERLRVGMMTAEAS